MSQNRKNTLNTMKIRPFSVLSDLILSYMRIVKLNKGKK